MISAIRSKRMNEIDANRWESCVKGRKVASCLWPFSVSLSDDEWEGELIRGSKGKDAGKERLRTEF